MTLGQWLGYTGGLLAIIAGLVSILTQRPLITHLTGITLIEGSVLIITGLIALIGGLIAIYFSYRRIGLYVIIGGILGLLAPCVLSVIAIIGGYLMLREK